MQITLTDGRTRRVTLTPGSYVLGRDPTCEIVIDDSSTSRRHVRIHHAEGGYHVEDMGSKNGTLLNNQRVANRRLRHQDELLIGSVQVRFIEGAVDHASTVVVSDGGPRDDTTHYSSRSSALVLTERRLQMLYDLSERLTTIRDRNALLEDALNICFETLRFERGAIAVRRANSRAVDWPVVRNLRGAGGELTISRSILGRAMDHGERAILTDQPAAAMDPTVSMVQHGIRSAMCVPLKNEQEILGVIYGDRVSTGTVYTKEDVDFLAGLARQVTIGLINARLLDEQRSKLEMEKELAVAREIQNDLFPQQLPEHDRLEFGVLNEPGRTVSGDYYDIVARPDGRFGFVIADVAGKGIAASLIMSNLQAAVRLTMLDCTDIGKTVSRWNNLIHGNTDVSKFVTCLAGIVDPASGRLELVSAGHQFPYLLSNGSVKSVQADFESQFPLGIVGDVDYRALTVDLSERPCTLFCFTDGIPEAMSASGEFFGDQRIEQLLADAAPSDPAGLIRHVRKALTQFCRDAPQSDDITIVALRLT
ncbi:MAG: SpoIIE family protein phosphatase [Phycisphaerales bacterium]|nr:SpoIIE family protein phosphatase [Phycisphaerales bacterium]